MDIKKLEEYEDVKELAQDLRKTLDSLAYSLQWKLLRKNLYFLHNGTSWTEQEARFWKIEGRGLAEALSEINGDFGTRYETDVEEINKYYRRPVRYK